MRIYDFEGKKNISGERIREAQATTLTKRTRREDASRGRDDGAGLNKPR